ncbi:MAG: hypothetical protein AB8B57_11035 [Congregibacter sp.]
MPFFAELKRRNVFRVGIAYAVIGWLIAQIAEFAFATFEAPDWVLKAVVVVLLLGLPIALLFAWAFEMTPDGVKREKDVDRSQSVTPKTGRKLNVVIIGTLVLALGYFVWERQTLPDPTTTPASANIVGKRSIAVLPFVNMSTDQEQEWFADGLTEEILNSLAKTPDVLVTARTSSFGFKGSTAPIPEIADALGVDHVLEGSVRRGRDSLRITAQLIRASDGFHLWSETYDRPLDDAILVQEDIAVQIATALETALDPVALKAMMSAGTTSVPAYNAYIAGIGLLRAAGRKVGFEARLQGRDELLRAVELDPEFAEAHFKLAGFWATEMSRNQIHSGLTRLGRDEIRRKRDKQMELAIRHQTDEAEQDLYRGLFAWQTYDLRRALRLLSGYDSLRPNSEDVRFIVTGLMLSLGRYHEATEFVREFLREGIFSESVANNAMHGLRTVEDSDLMREVANRAVKEFGDNSVTILYQSHRILLWAGDIEGAAALMSRIKNSNLPAGNQYFAELRQLCAEQRPADAEVVLQSMLAFYTNDPRRWHGLNMIGRRDEANQYLMAYDDAEDFEALASLLPYPQFDPRPFPRFMARMQGQGLEDRVVLDLPFRCDR